MQTGVAGAGAIITALVGIVVLIVLISRVRLHPFLALLLVALGLGIVSGVTPADSAKSFADGFGSTLTSTGPMIGLGTVLGGILLGTGGAERIAQAFVGNHPLKYAPWAICAAALLIGMPHLFDVSFVMLAPLVYTIAKQRNVHLLYIGIPLTAGLYISHGLLPPHPSPTLAVSAFSASTGVTLGYGLLIAIPSVVISGPLFTYVARRWFGPAPDLESGPAAASGTLAKEQINRAGLIPSITAVLLPPGLMLCGTIGLALYDGSGALKTLFQTLDNPVITLLIAVIFAFFALGMKSGFSLQQIQKMSSKGIAPLGTILLILGAGGGFKSILSSIHLDDLIAQHAGELPLDPLIMAWVVAAILRICLGSATVAVAASTAIVAPIALTNPGVSPELLVLATSSGSVMLSHVNDSGFWLFKEYFQLSIAQTFRTWTLMLCVQSVLGLLGVLLLQWLIS